MSLTHIVVIMDRSASMGSIKEEVIGGFNKFLADQKAEKGEALLTYVQFDNYYEVVHEAVKIAGVPPLDNETFVPRGWTALYDAIGRTLSNIKDVKADRTLVAIITDGEENASSEFNHTTVSNLISTKSVDGKFEFVFLAANQNAMQVGMGMGMKGANTHTFLQDSKGAKAMAAGLSATTSNYRNHGNAAYMEQDSSEAAT